MKTTDKITDEQGFSLIELLVVIGIIAVIAVLFIPGYRQYNERASLSTVASKLKDDIRALQNKSINSVIPTSGVRSKWYLQVATDPNQGTSYNLGACNSLNFGSCLTSDYDYEQIEVKTGYTVYAVAISPEPTNKYNGIANANLAFDVITGKMHVYSPSGLCLGSVVSGECGATEANIKIASVENTSSCAYLNINASGAVRPFEKDC